MELLYSTKDHRDLTAYGDALGKAIRVAKGDTSIDRIVLITHDVEGRDVLKRAFDTDVYRSLEQGEMFMGVRIVLFTFASFIHKVRNDQGGGQVVIGVSLSWKELNALTKYTDRIRAIIAVPWSHTEIQKWVDANAVQAM